MVKKESVNINVQLILVLLPITNLYLGGFWAAYRVQKLRKFLLITLVLSVISVLVVPSVDVDEYYEDEADDDLYYWISFWFNPLDGYFDNYIDLSIRLAWIGDLAAWFIVTAYYIRKWSIQWNKKMSRNTPV